MNREVIQDGDRSIEVVYDEQGTILFAKVTAVHRGFQVGSDMTTVSGYGLLVDIQDVGFTHLAYHEFELGEIIDYQYVDGNPQNSLSDAKIGCIKIYDSEGNIVCGESFRPRAFSKLVCDGNYIEDPDGISMSAPRSVKALIGKNINDIRTIEENTSKVRI